MESIVLIGASGLAREVISSLVGSPSQTIVGILADDAATLGDSFAGIPVLGDVARATEFPDARFVCCIGSGATREKIIHRLAEQGIGAGRYGRIIDPSVRNPSNCPVGEGSILLAQVAITADATVGRHVVAMPSVVITHDDVIADFATLAAGVVLGGGVHIGRAAYLGMNASVRQGVRVGAHSTLGMGAALLTDLPENQTWAGVPASPLRKR